MNKQSGQLLLEILIAVVAIVAIAGLGAQLILVGQKSNEITGDKDTALKLVEETFEAVNGITTENWNAVYGANKGQENLYHPEQSGKWALVTGSHIITINGVSYTRSLYTENVCRDTTTRDITGTTDTNGTTENCAESGGIHDPSTQKVSVNVSWSDGDTVSGTDYITRWRGKGCIQTDWTAQGSGTGACGTTDYGSIQNLSTGTELIIQ